MSKIYITLQQGNINQGHFYFNKEDMSFFPTEIIGGKNDSVKGSPATFYLSGVNLIINSDIDQTKRLIRTVRTKKAFKQFIAFYRLKAGDTIEICKKNEGFYHISPLDIEIFSADIKKEDASTVRKDTVVSRIVRDTYIANEVKALYDFNCQVCGLKIDTPKGPYAEGAHIKPLGKPHDGPDLISNILCLCPNHHVMFDRKVFTINDDFSLSGIEGHLRIHKNHSIEPEFIAYHRHEV